MELEYRFAGMDELDFLVRMRIRDLRMFSECAAGTKLEDAIRRFYEIKMKENACRTLLAYAGRELAATATLYFYDVLPSNENPSGRVGQITNVWADEAFRRQGIATRMVERLMEEARDRLDEASEILGVFDSGDMSGRNTIADKAWSIDQDIDGIKAIAERMGEEI